MDWTTPDDIVAQVVRRWENGTLLKAHLTREALYPLRLRLRGPNASAFQDRFDEARQWIRQLQAASCEARGFGYGIVWEERNFRVHGRNRVPAGLLVATEQDTFRLIGRDEELRRFDLLVARLLDSFPALKPWIVRYPLKVLEYGDQWELLLAVLRWFDVHPRSGLYLRQLEIPGVDTKFVEGHKSILSELFDCVMPPDVQPQTLEERFGLTPKPTLLRLRFLDERLFLMGISDLTAPVSQIARLNVSVRHVFIVENEISGLSFPDAPEAVVIFGLGYGLERLSQLSWLAAATVHYWGDIDTHGFAMLDRMRRWVPAARSFLMDRETLLAHRNLWGIEPDPYRGPVCRLALSEQTLFEDLQENRLGISVRLEQERIAFGRVREAVTNITGDRIEIRGDGR